MYRIDIGIIPAPVRTRNSADNIVVRVRFRLRTKYAWRKNPGRDKNRGRNMYFHVLIYPNYPETIF